MGCGSSSLKDNSEYDHLNSQPIRQPSSSSKQQQQDPSSSSNFNTKPMNETDFPNQTSATSTLWAQGVSPTAATAQPKPLFSRKSKIEKMPNPEERRKSDAQIEAFLESKRHPRKKSSSAAESGGAAGEVGGEQSTTKRRSRFGLTGNSSGGGKRSMNDEEYMRVFGMTKEEVIAQQQKEQAGKKVMPGSWGSVDGMAGAWVGPAAAGTAFN